MEFGSKNLKEEDLSYENDRIKSVSTRQWT